MQNFIIIDGLPYLYADGKAYAVRWDDEGFTLGEVFREDISPDDFIMLSELSVKAQCQELDSIGKEPEPDSNADSNAEADVNADSNADVNANLNVNEDSNADADADSAPAPDADKPKRGRKKTGDTE